MQHETPTLFGSQSDEPCPSVQRRFLGWGGALIPRAAAWMIHRAASGGIADLSSWIVVLPGSRAARLMLGELVDTATTFRVALLPPMCVTPGEVVDALFPPVGREPIGPLASGLAWEEAAQSVDAETLGAICMVGGSERGARGAAAMVAGVLHRLHEELAGHGLSFANVASRASTLGGTDEGERWKAAERVRERYAEVVASWGMQDVAMDRVRRVREERPSPAGSMLVLVGVAELSGVARAGLDRVCREGVKGRSGLEGALEIHSLIHAPEEEAQGFDAYGSVRCKAWENRDPGIAPDRLIFAHDTTEEADRALAMLVVGGDGARAGDPPRVSDVVIGLGDETRAALMELRASWGGTTRVRSAAGVRASATGPGRMIGTLAELCAGRQFGALAALVRHPDVESWLATRPDEGTRRGRTGAWWLEDLDRYMAEQMPWIIGDAMPEPKGSSGAGVRFVLREIGALLDMLYGKGQDGSRSAEGTGHLGRPSAWCARAIDVLRLIYGHLEVGSTDPETRRTVAACLAIDEIGRELARAETLGLGRAMRLDQTLRLIASALEGKRLAEAPDAEAVEMVGWLELALDPAPIAVVVGMNEGAVPASTNADPMLPGSLRRALGLPGSSDRLARDAFLMTTIARSRPSATFVCARRDDDGTPLMPSRLMLRCAQDALAARMGRALGRGGGDGRGVMLRPRVEPGHVCGFPIAPRTAHAGKDGAPSVTSMSVTSFGTYLASPYEFYLKHVLRLRQIEVDQPEMEAGTFGSLVHAALEQFGRCEARHSTRSEEIDAVVRASLDDVVRAWFGTRPTALVRVQVEHARERLRHWAVQQALWAGQGWRIEHVEWKPDKSPGIETARGRMALSGKIDRIDRNKKDGAWAIIDYKSGDKASTPECSHQTRSGWVDLQMPLYRTLASELGVGDTPTLAYFAIPRNVNEIKLRQASWKAQDYASADEAAHWVVEQVQAGAFEDIGSMRDDGTLALIAGLDVYQPSERAAPATHGSTSELGCATRGGGA